MRMSIELPTEKSVEEFCNAAKRVEQDVDVKYKHYTLDAKSNLAVLSIPREEKLEVFIHNVDLSKSNLQGLCDVFEPFRCT